MAVTNISVFTSFDQGAVSGVNGRCSGTAGDAIALFNQCLLTGYNWQEVTAANLTQAANVATLILNNHGFNINQRLWLCGADQSGYNNDATYLTSITDSNTVTFPVTGGPASPSTISGSTTLSAAISDTTSTSITVSSAASFPSSGQTVIKIDSEYMLVTAGLGTTTWTVVRGFAQSTAATHSNGANVTQKILIGVAPAGGYNHWTADFTATNKSTYRPPAGNRMWLDVDDTFTTYCKVRGYVTMTAVGTGTGAFPTQFQYADATAGQAMTKSNAASTAARPWVVLATDRSLMVFVDHNNSIQNPGVGGSGILVFTDLIDVNTAVTDNYATLLIAESSNGGGTSSTFDTLNQNAISNHYMPRSFTQIGGSIQVGKDCLDNRSTSNFGGPLALPHPPDGYVYVSKLQVTELIGGSNLIQHRGNIPILWAVLHPKTLGHLDIISGTGALSGKRFMAINVYSAHQIFAEVSNTVEAT